MEQVFQTTHVGNGWVIVADERSAAILAEAASLGSGIPESLGNDQGIPMEAIDRVIGEMRKIGEQVGVRLSGDLPAHWRD